MDKLAKNEPPISYKQLLAEIAPLLTDNFVGRIIFNGKAIIYTMPNGQTFEITAHTV